MFLFITAFYIIFKLCVFRVLSDDGDSFLYGANVIIRNWCTVPTSLKNKNKRKAADVDDDVTHKKSKHDHLASGHVEIYSAQHLKSLTGHSRESLVMTALLGGSDETAGISGIGIKVASG